MTNAPGTKRVLVIGYGNPARRDDGLGPALAERIEALHLPGVTVEEDYQLNVEDAEAVARHDVAVFVDASLTAPPPFAFYRVRDDGEIGFTTHSVSPEAVVQLARTCFGATTDAYVLAVRGEEFDGFGEALGDAARSNLARAAAFLEGVLRTESYDKAAAGVEPPAPERETEG